MNIEEPIERLKLDSKYAGLCLNGGTTCIVNISDLDWLLTAYEKEKEKNKRLTQCHYQYEEMTGIDLLLPEKEG